jgi:transglutaminase-like putative cysteine protease
MLRMIGIPARVAAGFRTGAYHSATGAYSVSARDAHSWVEVYFTGIGWVPFDPTPPLSPGGNRYSPSYTQQISDPRQAIAA